MISEEFYNLIKRSKETEAYYQELYDGFYKKLPGALAELVFKHLPEFYKQQGKYEKAILKIGEKYVGEIWEIYNNAYSLNVRGGPMADLNPARKPITREEAEQQRLKEIKALPEKHHKRYSQIFWESYEERLAIEKFEYAVYEKMKEVFTVFYFDDIMEFESHILRYFDRAIHLMCSGKYIDKVYSLL